MELDLNITLGGPALLVGVGLLLWFLSAPMRIPGFFFPLSLVLLVLGAWFLLKYLRDQGSYESRIYPFSSLDQTARRVIFPAERTEEKPEELSAEPLKKEVRAASTDSLTITQKPEGFSLEEWLRQVSRSVKEEAPQPSVESVVDSQAVYKEVASQVAESSTARQFMRVNKPTREQLGALKKKLTIEEGSLQYKDGSVYLVTSNREAKKHVWKKLGRWRDLANSLTIAQPEEKVSES